jgi:hypothetical protein
MSAQKLFQQLSSQVGFAALSGAGVCGINCQGRHLGSHGGGEKCKGLNRMETWHLRV